jgi:hypothetical protein
MNSHLKNCLFVAFALVALIACVALISGNARADTHVWDGEGANNLGTTAGNWYIAGGADDVAPVATDAIIFNSTSSKNCTLDNAVTFSSFTIDASYAGIVTTADAINVGVDGGITIGAGKTINIGGSGGILQQRYFGGTWIVNGGTIGGTGTLKCIFYDTDITASLGIVNAPVIIDLLNSAPSSRTLTLSANAAFGSSFLIDSAHATNTMTLNQNGYSLSATTITASTRGIISSSVAGARIIDTGALTVSANGRLDATNIAYITCGGTWDSSAGYFWPGVHQVNMTNVGNIKLATTQFFYDLRGNTGYIYTLTANCTVQHQLNLIGAFYGTPYILKINGSYAVPFVGNGSSLPIINITSTAAAYTIYTNYNWAGTVQMQKNCTVKLSNGGQLQTTQGASPKWYNLTVKAWAGPSNFKWWAGSTNAAANLTFIASGLLASTTYEIMLDGTLSGYVTSNGAGVATFYHASWSHHLLLVDQTPTITTLPVTVDTMGGVYRYDANASEAVTWAITCSDPDIDIDANGVVSGYLSNDSQITVTITATDVSGGVATQSYTIFVHGPMADLGPIMITIIPLIALIVIISMGVSSIKRKR